MCWELHQGVATWATDALSLKSSLHRAGPLSRCSAWPRFRLHLHAHPLPLLPANPDPGMGPAGGTFPAFSNGSAALSCRRTANIPVEGPDNPCYRSLRHCRKDRPGSDQHGGRKQDPD